jgi:uncharacterized surface protein with fasciclin (FAS1) repeats
MNKLIGKGLSRSEGIILVMFGLAMTWFSILGNYEYLMNPRFRWLTVTGSVLVLCVGTALALVPRGRPSLSGIISFVAISAIVAIGRPYANDVNSLTLPDLQGISGIPLVIGDQRYSFIGLDEMNRNIVPGSEGYEDRRIVVTGLLKEGPELAADGHVAVVRPFSVCCAADALIVGIRAEGEADSLLSDKWVNAYGTIRRVENPLTSPRIRHGAIRYATLSKEYLLVTDRIEPYIRPRPTADIMERLSKGNFDIFLKLAESAGLREMLKNHEMVTVLAPVDASFDGMPEGFVEDISKRVNRDRLRSLIGRHVLLGSLNESDLRDIDSVKTITGETVLITLVNGKLRAGDSRFLFKNIEASDGTIHAIYPVIRYDSSD